MLLILMLYCIRLDLSKTLLVLNASTSLLPHLARQRENKNE